MNRFVCEDAMITDLHCLEKVMRLKDIVDTLDAFPANGFPVIRKKPKAVSPRVPTRHGRSYSAQGYFLGTILRYQLIVVLRNKGWGRRTADGTDQELVHEDAFIDNQHIDTDTSIQELRQWFLPSAAEMEDLWIDLRPYMNYNPSVAVGCPPRGACAAALRLV